MSFRSSDDLGDEPPACGRWTQNTCGVATCAIEKQPTLHHAGNRSKHVVQWRMGDDRE